MRFQKPAALRASSRWLIVAAFALALVSIAVVTTLQNRARTARDAEVVLLKIARDFDALQSIPFDGNGEGGEAQAAVRAHMAATEQRIARGLTQLQREHPSSHMQHAEAHYKANFATIGQIERYVARGEDDQGDALGPVAGRSQRAFGREIGEAGIEYRRIASKSLTLATLGSAGMIIALVSLFAVFFLRSQKAHAIARRLARDNARLLLEDSQLQVIQRLALAAEYRDDETGQHTRRVGEVSARIGQALGMPDDELVLLRQSAPLHDVGKIAIPDSILLKPGPLEPEEFDRMKTHTARGAAMLTGRGFALLEMAESIALTHHERWEGGGYPSGLSGPAIPLVGRIVAIADVFDALTHARPYKHAWTEADAVAEISSQSGRQFDPAVVEAFLRVLPDLGPDVDPDADAVRFARAHPRDVTSAA